MNPARKQAWKAWIAAILWLILIAIESTDLLSAANTSRFLYPLLHWLIGLDPVRFLIWNYYIRKIGHFIGYFGLSLLLYRAWKLSLATRDQVSWSIESARIAFVMTALVACLDEWHQSYLASRTGTLWDVALDSSGALLAQIVIFLWSRYMAERFSTWRRTWLLPSRRPSAQA